MSQMSRDDTLQAIYWRDDILQVMYWFLGEGFGQEVALNDLITFLGSDEHTVKGHLDNLVEEGCIQQLAEGRYKLTDIGAKEGRRRFLDEFEPLLRRSGHGECGRPDCECHEGTCRTSYEEETR